MGGDRVLHRLGLVAAIASTCVIGSKVALSQTPKKGGTFFLGRTRRSVASSSKAGRTHSQVLTALRASSRATDRFRAGHQSPNRPDSWPHGAADAHRHRRRGDRISEQWPLHLLHLHTAVSGTKRHCRSRTSAWQQSEVLRTGFDIAKTGCERQRYTDAAA